MIVLKIYNIGYIATHMAGIYFYTMLLQFCITSYVCPPLQKSCAVSKISYIHVVIIYIQPAYFIAVKGKVFLKFLISPKILRCDILHLKYKYFSLQIC